MFAVAGVTGNTGKATALALLAAGKKVRVIVRDAEKGRAFAEKGAEVAVADLGDAEALHKALTGVDGAYLLVPPAMVPAFFAYQAKTTDAIVAAVTAARVPHVVFLSSFGAELSEGTGPVLALHRAEQILAQLADTKVTFLRAGYFIENLASSLGGLAHGVLPGFYPVDLTLPFVATQDIGAAAAQLLIEGPQTGVVEVSSQAGSMTTAAEAASRISGKTIQAQSMPLSAMIPALKGFGIPDEMAQGLHDLTQTLTAGNGGWDKAHRHIQGTTTIETVLRGLMQS